MKFKEIKPGMVIHCPTEEDAEALLEHLEELGYMWAEGSPLTANNYWSNFRDRTCYWIYDSEAIAYGNIRSAEECNKAITEFSDLIEPDSDIVPKMEWEFDLEKGYLEGKPVSDSPINSPADSPMMAVELLKWIREGFINGCAGLDNRLREVFDTISVEDILTKFTVEEIIEKIEQYETAKKAPKPVKVKEGYYCDIYTEDEQIINYIMYGVDEQTATADAREKAIQNTMETGSRTFANVMFVCEEDES